MSACSHLVTDVKAKDEKEEFSPCWQFKMILRPPLSRHANHPHLYCVGQKWGQESELFSVTIQYFGPCPVLTNTWEYNDARAPPPSLPLAYSTRTKTNIYLLIIYFFLLCRDIHTVQFLYFWHSYNCWHVDCLFSMNALLWKEFLFEVSQIRWSQGPWLLLNSS